MFLGTVTSFGYSLLLLSPRTLSTPSSLNLLFTRIHFNLHQSVKMLRQFIRPAATVNRAVFTRSFSVAVPRMGEGDTGAPRGGAGGSSG